MLSIVLSWATIVTYKKNQQTQNQIKADLQNLDSRVKGGLENKVDLQVQDIQKLQQKVDQLNKDLQSKREEKERLAAIEASKTSVLQKLANSTASKAEASSGGSSALSQWLYTLRMCEAGGNYRTNTGNGFYGAYQFMIQTWNTIAGMSGRTDLIGVRPDLASPADQDMMIVYNTNVTQGLVTQNPGCYRKTGISNKPPA